VSLKTFLKVIGRSRPAFLPEAALSLSRPFPAIRHFFSSVRTLAHTLRAVSFIRGLFFRDLVFDVAPSRTDALLEKDEIRCRFDFLHFASLSPIGDAYG